MKDSVIDKISQKPVDKHEDDLLMKHDVKIQELSIRLDHIENNINRIMNNKICWDVIEDDETKA